MASSKLTQWKKKRIRTVTLPSDVEVDLAMPNLPAMIKAGKLPNNLVKMAMGEGSVEQEDDVALAGQLSDFQETLVALTVVDPPLEVDDVKELPYEDIAFIFDFALRGTAAKEAGQESLEEFQGVSEQPVREPALASS